ncbi:MAG: hypothetical protein ABFE07_29150 [Armatimonadia bacterium]
MTGPEREIMAQAAQAIRRLEAENLRLQERLGTLEKTASFAQGLSKQVEAARLALRLVADGETDPGDVLEKFAQICELSPSQIEQLLRNGDSEKLGQVRAGPGADGDDNPLLAYLLGSG